MKKFLKVTAAVILLLLIFFVGTFKYRQYQANQVLVPANATSILKLNADQLYKTIAFNMLAHPWQYLKPDGQKDRSQQDWEFNTGLKMPSALYVYTLENESKTSFYTRLKIKDSKLLMHFLQQQLHFKVVKNSDQFYLATSPTQNISVLFGELEAAFVFSMSPQNDLKLLQSILEEKNFIPLAESPFKNTMSATDHVVYSSQHSLAALNFNSGNIEFSEEYESKNIIPALKPLHRRFNPESTLTMWLSASIKSDSEKQYINRNFKLEKDSLIKYFKGNLDLEWIDSTQQTDSIITYAYNDDFEKEEKVSVQKRNVPNVTLTVHADAIALKNYLSRQHIINLDSNVLNKTVFPLYKVHVETGEKYLVLSTQKGQNPNQNQVASNDFFYLNVNFLKLNKQVDIPFLTPYFKTFKQLECKGKSIGPGKVKLDGKLELVNQDLNALYQILKAF